MWWCRCSKRRAGGRTWRSGPWSSPLASRSRPTAPTVGVSVLAFAALVAADAAVVVGQSDELELRRAIVAALLRGKL